MGQVDLWIGEWRRLQERRRVEDDQGLQGMTEKYRDKERAN